MKEILVILAQSPEFGMYRTDLIFAIEKDQWMKKTRIKESSFHERLLTDSVRVSYDRTLAKLKKLGLIKGGWPDGVKPLSPWEGTLWSGQRLILTDKGKKVASEIIQETLRQVLRLNQLILNGLDNPYRVTD